MKLGYYVNDSVFRMCMNCYESALLDGWMKENACKIIYSDIEPW